MWGQNLIILEQDPNSDKKFLGYLFYLKEIRNTLQHPDERLSQKDAEQSFMHILHLIKKIVEFLISIKEKKAHPRGFEPPSIFMHWISSPASYD